VGGQADGSVAHVLLDAVALCDQGPLKDDAALLVALTLLRCKLVDPAQLGVAVLAGYVAHHVPARQHHPPNVSLPPVVEVDDFVEEERPPRGAREPGADELVAVCQHGVAAGAGEQPGAANVLQEYPAHSRP
ncbi:unnamed protein product, partial [Ixodes pacificus]